jgi:type IV fimbrial biogenesis protein FimT
VFPVYNHLILDFRLFILTDRVRSSLNYAQTEAIKRQCVIAICKSKDGKSCSGSWENGWIVLISKNSDSSLTNANPLRAFPALSQGEFLEWHGFHSDNYLKLFPDGSIQNGRFILCVNALTKKMARFIKISPTGRIRIGSENNKNKICND